MALLHEDDIEELENIRQLLLRHGYKITAAYTDGLAGRLEKLLKNINGDE